MAHGALVYAIGPFWRDGNGPLRIPQNAPEAMACMKQIDDKMVLHELLSTCTRELVDDKCNVKLILFGVCFDGRFVLRANQHLQLDGIAMWHGAGLPAEIAPKRLSTTEITLDFSTDGPLFPINEVDALRVSICHPNTAIRVHTQCWHGFSHRDTNQWVPEAANAAA